jgi:hypothetical protein
MSRHGVKPLRYLVYGLLIVLVFGGYVLFEGLHEDSSATMAPTLNLIR